MIQSIISNLFLRWTTNRNNTLEFSFDTFWKLHYTKAYLNFYFEIFIKGSLDEKLPTYEILKCLEHSYVENR